VNVTGNKSVKVKPTKRIQQLHKSTRHETCTNHSEPQSARTVTSLNTKSTLGGQAQQTQQAR